MIINRMHLKKCSSKNIYQKMSATNFSLKSGPGVQFYLFRGVSESNFEPNLSRHLNFTHQES